MEIIPKLNLNRNPKDIPSGSLVAAKNMIIDDTGSYFTNEYGFSVAFECPNDGEFICGVIPTNKELVIFTYDNVTSRIYRYKNGTYKEVNKGWKYSGGKITGSYTYNYKDELIVSVGEYDAIDSNGNKLQVPYKSWNLDNCINTNHNQEEYIGEINADYNLISGNLVCGVYTFFVRFLVSDYDYTKWFQITNDIFIIDSINATNIQHTYLVNFEKTINNTLLPNVNSNAMSNKGIRINCTNFNNNFHKYQIGYIIKHDEEVLGRILNTYDSTIESIDIISNNYIEEESIDNLLKNPNQLYNVKNIINYNNRIYLSNYEEYKNENIINNEISISINRKTSQYVDISNKENVDAFRSLIPFQKYNIFIHYIRKDHSYTNGFHVATIITPSETMNGDKSRYILKFTNRNLSNRFIGYFFSYEDIEYNACNIIKYNIKRITNTDYLFKIDSIIGNYIDGNKNNPIVISNKYISPTRYLGVNDSNGYFLTTDDNNQYNKKVKTLYRLSKNYYNIIEDEEISNYIPNFRQEAIIVNYKSSYRNENDKVIDGGAEIIINPAATSVINMDGKQVTYYINVDKSIMYSKYYYASYNIKQKLNEGSVSLTDKDGKAIGVFYNKVLSPDKLCDYLEVKSSYTSKPSKSFTNYQKDYTNIFNKTIRRSNVISDESLVNGFRLFDTEEYKIIKENKGDITNIVGIGFYLLVHTQYSLFVFDRSPQLTNKSQLQIPDTFNIDYQEVLPSNEGFGGLWNKEESIISKNGYIWYDKVNKYIFKYENGKVSILSSDINNFIKDINIDTIRFGEDLKTNRLLICIYINKYTITLSYNFNTNSFISMHDYSFTNCYRTYNEAFFFDNNKDKSRLYIFDKESNTYHNLITTNPLYYPILL